MNYSQQWRNFFVKNQFINFLLPIILLSFHVNAQESTITIPASKKYTRSEFYQKLWGHHYRKEWETPVSFRIAMIDTLTGGLTPYEAGGGRQSKSLRLRDANPREYVLRSIDKSFGKALPEIIQGTFIESMVNDQVTIAHPYSAFTIATMAEAAKIYHTNPRIYYIPKQKSLGEFNESFGDVLYLFEQRPDENWETAVNFGNSKSITGTDKMLEKIHKDNDNSVDQVAFVRARLFDMFIGDWGRHEDQWRWASFKDDKKTVYKPIPRDRDQAYTIFDGKVTSFLISLAGIRHLQSFEGKIKDLKHYNFPARNLDRHLTNSVTQAEWIRNARELQSLLTDDVIDSAIKQLPPEVYNISGPEIASKLKSRRQYLEQYADKYYHFLAKEVDITGSEDTELFEVKRINNDSTEVNIYKITNEGKIKDNPFYHRVFNNNETKEIRLYGLNGKDEYRLTGNVSKGIDIRLIGGPDNDKFIDESSVKKSGHQTKIYDNRMNEFSTSGETSLRLSSSQSVHTFKYDAFNFDKKRFKPLVMYNRDDRIYVGIAYSFTKQQWRKLPFGYQQSIDIKYSISQNAFSSTYKGLFTQLLGRWDGVLYGNYDFIKWTNFFGLGNDTKLVFTNQDYNRMRTKTYKGSAGVQRLFGSHKISLSGFYQDIKIINDSGRYVAKNLSPLIPAVYQDKNFAGADFAYSFQQLNDSVLPTKGVSLFTGINYTNNIRDNSRSFEKYSGELNLYASFTRNIGITVKAGGATLSGTPEFYQYNNIGGTRTLRGYRRERFYGNSTFYNQNELRWISDVRSYIFNGKLGIFALYDIGRVWLKGEKSNTWHNGYGGGIIISPFNKIALSASYAISAEDKTVHLNVIKVL